MKTCGKCKIEKPFDEFNSRGSSRPGSYSSYCKPCQAAASQSHYTRDKSSYMGRSAEVAKNQRLWLRSLKEGKPCTDCQVVYPFYVMQWDHIGTDKSFNISNAPKKFGRQTILDEIAKCELVCANCHAERTHGRRSTDVLQ